jgi:acyl carrier protein
MKRDEIKEKVIDTISALRGIDPTTIHEDLILEDDLGMDSLDMVETVMSMESQLSVGIPDDDALRKEMSVREFINHLDNLING